MQTHRRNWEELGNLDPMWAILSDTTKHGGRWNASDFFATGEHEIDSLMREINVPLHRCLDFGCGIGRLTKALAKYFTEAHGVDISETMIEKARILTPEATFWHNDQPNLSLFPSGHFDLVYSYIVLQHIPDKEDIRAYIREFVRLLTANGMAVFQLPGRLPFRRRIQFRRRAYSILRSVMSAETLYRRLRLAPIQMNWLPESAIESVVASAGGKIIRRKVDSSTYLSVTYFVTLA